MTARAISITVLYFAAASTETGLTTEEIALPKSESGEAAGTLLIFVSRQTESMSVDAGTITYIARSSSDAAG